jgi:hypothetical protein
MGLRDWSFVVPMAGGRVQESDAYGRPRGLVVDSSLSHVRRATLLRYETNALANSYYPFTGMRVPLFQGSVREVRKRSAFRQRIQTSPELDGGDLA